MDPFLQLYCLACHNVWMYCDCVHSFDDVIPEDATSHESEAGEDDNDSLDTLEGENLEPPATDQDQWPNDSGPWDGPSPNKKPKPDHPTSGNTHDLGPSTPQRPPKQQDTKPTPGKDHQVLVDKPKPMPGDPGPTIAQKPPGGYTYKPWEEVISDSLTTPQRPPKRPDIKPTPPRDPYAPPKHSKDDPPTDDVATIGLRYYQPTTGRPYPFLYSPSINKLVDNLGMPIYTKPQNPSSQDWAMFVAMELYPWYNGLTDENKWLYLDACFVSDPSAGQQAGANQYYRVSIKYDHGAGSGKKEIPYVYTVTPLDGSRDPVSVYSDYRLPPRAFSGNASFEEYFIIDGDHYIPRYKEERAAAARSDPWYDTDAIGFRMALKPNWDASAIAPTLPTIDPSLPPDPPKFARPPFLDDPNWFVNSRGNTKSINGIGYKSYLTSPGGSGYFEPFFDAGYVSQTLWKTNGNDPQYPSNPVGNVPNPLGFTGIINPTQVFQSSSVALVYNPQDYSSTRTFMYGNTTNPMDVFNFPCECVNRGTNGVSAFYHVSVECKVITWDWNTPMWNVYSLKRSGSTATKVFHELYDGVIMDSRPDGLQRVAIEQMTKLKDRGDPSAVTVPGTISIGSTWTLSILVEVPDNDGYLDSTKNGDPFIFVQLNDSQLEIVKVKTMLKDNTRTARVDGKASLAALVAAGTPLSLFGDFDLIDTTYLWNNRALNVVSWFSSTQIAKKIGLFKRFGATNQLQISSSTIWNNDNIYKSRNVGWPVLPFYIPTNTNYVGNGLDIAVDTFRLGPADKSTESLPGFLQQHINVLLMGLIWLPMDY